MQLKIIDFNSLITMDIQNEINIAAEQLSRTKCPDCGGFHKVELTYYHQNGWLVDNLDTIRCERFNSWASMRIKTLAQSLNLLDGDIGSLS